MSNRKIEKVISVTQGNLWLTKRVKNKTDNLSTDGSEKGKGIGEQIVRGIRFPVMTQHEFAAVVDCCMMLTQDQALILFSYFYTVPDTQVGFPETNMTGLKGELFECRLQICFRAVHTGSDYPYSLLFLRSTDILTWSYTIAKQTQYQCCNYTGKNLE